MGSLEALIFAGYRCWDDPVHSMEALEKVQIGHRSWDGPVGSEEVRLNRQSWDELGIESMAGHMEAFDLRCQNQDIPVQREISRLHGRSWARSLLAALGPADLKDDRSPAAAAAAVAAVVTVAVVLRWRTAFALHPHRRSCSCRAAEEAQARLAPWTTALAV